MKVPPKTDLARTLLKAGGLRSGKWINISGPGHRKKDRSLGVLLDPKAPNGFRVNSLAGDDYQACRRHVKALLRRANSGDLNIPAADDIEQVDATQSRLQAMRIWAAALPIAGTPAATYLALRRCAPVNGEDWPSDLRFHPACAFNGGLPVPALVALVRIVGTGEPSAVLRIAIRNDGSGKREMPEGMSAKTMKGSVKSGAVMLHPPGTELGLAEGIETALSARKIFKMPVWAGLSASGIQDFPDDADQEGNED